MRSIPRKLIYRHPRFRVDLPIVLHDGEGRAISGRCSELSSEGAGLRLREMPFTGDPVRIEISLGDCLVSVPARLVYQRDGNVFGLRFLPSSADEREEIARLVATVQHHPFV